MTNKINIDNHTSIYNCPICGNELEWVGGIGEAEAFMYYDEYKCENCGKKITYEFKAVAAYIENIEN